MMRDWEDYVGVMPVSSVCGPSNPSQAAGVQKCEVGRRTLGDARGRSRSSRGCRSTEESCLWSWTTGQHGQHMLNFEWVLRVASWSRQLLRKREHHKTCLCRHSRLPVTLAANGQGEQPGGA